MEIILALSFIAFLILAAFQGPTDQHAPDNLEAPVKRAHARATPTGASDGTPVKGTRSVSADDCWVAPGREVTVAGYTIPRGDALRRPRPGVDFRPSSRASSDRSLVAGQALESGPHRRRHDVLAVLQLDRA